MTSPFAHTIQLLTGIAGPRLSDETGLPAVAIAAASAAGLTPHGPPVTRVGPRGVAVSLLCHAGHLVLHAVPETGTVLVDVVGPAGAPLARALEVIGRRLGATSA
jgi:S-adenosylmethionine/arginine decarboxylase-like enzyme